MATLMFGMIQSLDGRVAAWDGALQLPVPGPELFRHFVARMRGLSGSIYGRRIYELMRYWEEDRPEWGEDERDFAQAWRACPKWVASRSLREVGPGASLIQGELGAFVRALKAERSGQLEVAGPELAAVLGGLGLVDEYWLYLRPFVVGEGKPFFAGPLPPLSLIDCERVGEDAVRLRYRPAG